MTNPAFEFLRQYKEVKPATEEIVLKTLKKKFPNLTVYQLTEIFSSGVTGEYGKVYSIDPQTLIGWVYEYMNKQENPLNYLDEPLLDNTLKNTDRRYPSGNVLWEKEVNKCYSAYLRGVSVNEFHPHIFDRLVMDNKLHYNDFLQSMSKEELEFYQNGEYEKSGIRKAKQKTIGKYFDFIKSSGDTLIYPNVK